MSKVKKSKRLSLDEIKNIIVRGIRLGSEHDNLSDTTDNLYTRQLIKLYRAGVAKQQWSPKMSSSPISSIQTNTTMLRFKRHSKFKTRFDLANAKRTAYIKLVFNYVALWLNVHYPLRLVWPSVLLTPEDGANYLQGNKLHLNDFKNVRLMGPQTIQLDSTTMSLIKSYLELLTNTVGEKPEKLLWRNFKRQPGEYDYTNSSNSFSQVLSKLFLKY
ncbi:unnamed protein product [Phytophthora lilii]|uniref:Unnamed protein product n=1 Tax=Phytophthora lilii TaxID=2077276 RepID=A0A9W7CQZ2_9STRA|nr:unnamed protein product [Phytophthora lilii]